jgi:acyl-CoA synthetase (AMP-forming)/AMP-acid ligase II
MRGPQGLKERVDRSGPSDISCCESALTGYPCLAEAAVIAVPHPRWDERRAAVAVLKPNDFRVVILG